LSDNVERAALSRFFCGVRCFLPSPFVVIIELNGQGNRPLYFFPQKATLAPFFAPYIIERNNREEITELADATLVQRCLAGDAEAFSTLVKKYESAVYGLCYHKVGNFTDAQDLAQEAFVQAYLDLPQLRDATKFSHWLYRIASNVCTTWLRRQGRKRKIQSVPLDDALEEYGDFIDEKASSPHDAVEYKELSAPVADAISALSEKNRLAVTLYYIDGLSYGEIADFLDVPQSTAKSRLNKARKKLVVRALCWIG
jgi:RNA polymerase sigma-70 factor (ECF subfamily)